MVELCKMLFDMCFYYTFVGYCLYMFTLESPSVWGIPVIILSTIVSLALKKFLPEQKTTVSSSKLSVTPQTLLCCVLPGSFLLFMPTMWQIIHFVPAWAYFCYMALTDKTHIDRIEFRQQFAYSSRILLLMVFGIISLGRMKDAILGAVPYFILYLFIGVCLMRILREDGKLSAGRNVFTLLLVLLGGAALVLFQAPQLLLTAAGFLYNYVLLNVLKGAIYMLGAVFVVVFWVIKALLSLLSSGTIERGFEFEGVAEEILGEELSATIVMSPEWLKYAWYTFLVLLVALILLLLLRGLLGRKKGEEIESPFSEKNDGLVKHGKQKRIGIFRPRNPRQMVRWLYRKYLKESISRGALLATADTSRIIQHKNEALFPQNESEGIRNLYIAARYKYGEATTESEALEASELWKKLKHKHEQK